MSANPYSEVEQKAEAAARGATRGVIGTFFREYWLWILIPFALVFLGLLAVYFLAGGGDGASPFQYNVF